MGACSSLSVPVPVHGLQRLAGIAADKSDEVIRVFNSGAWAAWMGQ